MAKVRVEIIYVDKLEKVLVNGVAINDLTSIQYKPVHEWFAASNGRDGWEGLIPEIFNIVDDQSAELCFEFVGPNEKAHIFLECLQEIGYGDTSISPEEVAKRNLEGARRAEHRGLYLQAFENYLNAADYGNSAEAQYEVAKFYYAQFKEDKSRGEHICGDIPKLKAIGNAVKYWEKAAQQGFSEACFRLHELFSFGDGVTKDQTEAVKWLTAAINNLEASPLTKIETAFTSVDEIMEEIGKNADALQVYQQAAEKNYVVAQLVVGVCYESGNGIKQNLSMAAEWYQKAAEQNYAPAQLKLGSCYDKGEGVKKNLQTAVKWYRKAAEQNYTQAQFELGICYDSGKGVERNSKTAVEWYRKAAEQNYAPAQFWLGMCYSAGEGVERNSKIAVEWYRKAAKQNYILAQRHLGVCYECGLGVKKDLKIAIEWYQKAAEGENSNAEDYFQIGLLYESFSKRAASNAMWTGALVAVGVVIPVTNLITMPAALAGSKLIGLTKKNSFKQSEAGEKMMKYYRKAAALGHPEAKKKLKHWK